ncbi:MAG: GntR family transcriptional regulator [Candidatus Brocadiia bacterium]
MTPINRQPLHEQIADILRREIRTQHKPGDRLDSESKLAERFAVSTVTLREAMLQLSQEGLIERRHGSGTYVLDEAGQQRIVILVNPDILSESASYFWTKVTRETQRMFEDKGIRNWGELGSKKPPRDYPHLDGAVAISAYRNSYWPQEMLDRGIPIVGNDPALDCFVHNDMPGMVRGGVQYIIDTGRERPALLLYKSQQAGMREAFRKTLKENGLKPDPELICTETENGESKYEGGAFQKLWEKPIQKPDAILVADDVVFKNTAYGILSRSIDVPRELLVLTHANKGADLFYPFPTVRLQFDPTEYARALVDGLSKRMAGEPNPDKEVLLSHTMVGTETIKNLLEASE